MEPNQQQARREAAVSSADPMRGVLDTDAMDGITNLTREAGVQPGFELAGARQGNHTGGDIITAQRVAVPRNIAKIMATLKALAASAGKNYVYGWKVKDKRNNRETWIEGPTIKLANDLARTYGNCMVNVRVVDAGATWMMYGRFVDLETGFTTERAYQQRKSQNVGMQDEQRGSDMVFQIGQSKCIRNVIVNALQTFADFAVEAAKDSLLDMVGKEPDKARAWIVRKLAELNVDKTRVEAIYGRTSEHWTVPDMARIYTEVQTIIDGMMVADEVYPVPGANAEVAETVKTPPGKKVAAAKNAPPPPASAGDQQASESKGTASPPAPPVATGGAAGGAPQGCPVYLDLNDVPIAHTSDAMLKVGDPIVAAGAEYVVESVGKRQGDDVPVYKVVQEVRTPPTVAEKPAAPRRSMFRKQS